MHRAVIVTRMVIRIRTSMTMRTRAIHTENMTIILIHIQYLPYLRPPIRTLTLTLTRPLNPTHTPIIH